MGTTNQRLNELLNNTQHTKSNNLSLHQTFRQKHQQQITPSAQQTIAIQNKQQNDHLLYQQQQQRALRQQQQLVHAQQQISAVPPHPSQFSNPQIYKPILDTTAHPQFATMPNQQRLTSPNSNQQQFQQEIQVLINN